MVRRICDDRNRLEQANEALERLAVTDQLTGAFNRLRLNEIMKILPFAILPVSAGAGEHQRAQFSRPECGLHMHWCVCGHGLSSPGKK